MVIATAGVSSANGGASGAIYVPIDIGVPVDVRVLIYSSIDVIVFVDGAPLGTPLALAWACKA